MQTRVAAWLTLSLAMAVLAACSRPEAPAPAVVADAPVTTLPAEKVRPSACSLVTQEEMSTIIGMPVVGVPDESSSGVTGCVYTAPTSLSPDAWLKVAWGEGETLSQGLALAERADPDLADPLAGLGDEAAQVGPTLMILSGEDSVEIYLTGISDVVPPAQKILALVESRR